MIRARLVREMTIQLVKGMLLLGTEEIGMKLVWMRNSTLKIWMQA